jgi:carbonic anhydrase
MGNNVSKNDAKITTEYRKDTIIKTILKTDEFRLAFQMKATNEESDKVQNLWQDFISGARNVFSYQTATKYPQTIKIMKIEDKYQLVVATTIDLKEEDIEKFTKMFNEISKNIKKYDRSEASGLTSINSNSSLNLLVNN